MNHNYKTSKDYERLWDKYKDHRIIGFYNGSILEIFPSRLGDKDHFIEWCEDLEFIDPEPEREAFNDGVTTFAAWLVDNVEGETAYEENIAVWVGRFIHEREGGHE